jgi:hypothetical protein
VQRIALDEAEVLIAVAAFEGRLAGEGSRAGANAAAPRTASLQALRAARALLDGVTAARPKDPQVAGFAQELGRRWSELSRQLQAP